MFNRENTIPDYMTERGNVVRLIIFTAAFALVFINIYAPFGVETWYRVTRLQLFFYSSLVILTGVLVVVISRVLMCVYFSKRSLTYGEYALWVLAEVFCMALFYAFFEKLILSDSRDFSQLLKVSVENTALVLLLPYGVLWLFFSWREKKQQLALLYKGKELVESSLFMVPFQDEKGVMRFSVKGDDLLYLEAADNYVNIYYADKGGVSHFMLRNTLKALEPILAPRRVIRCHRSFMVNFERVKVIRKLKDGLQLELDGPLVQPLPVSKTYVKEVLKGLEG